MAATLSAEETYGSMKKIKWTWTSDTSGDAAGATTTEAYNGKIQGLTTVPSTTTPTDNYDVEILDEDGVDVLMGGGADRDQTTTEYVLATSLGAVANDKMYLSVSNAGDTKAGAVYLYLR